MAYMGVHYNTMVSFFSQIFWLLLLIQRNQPENSYESVDPVEAAKLLGTPNAGKVSLIKTELVEYDMVNKKEDTKVYNNAILLLQYKTYKILKDHEQWGSRFPVFRNVGQQ